MGRNIRVRAGVDNLLDVNPPLQNRDPGDQNNINAQGFGQGYSEGTIANGVYDRLGRSYFVGVKWSL